MDLHDLQNVTSVLMIYTICVLLYRLSDQTPDQTPVTPFIHAGHEVQAQRSHSTTAWTRRRDYSRRALEAKHRTDAQPTIASNLQPQSHPPKSRATDPRRPPSGPTIRRTNSVSFLIQPRGMQSLVGQLSSKCWARSHSFQQQ